MNTEKSTEAIAAGDKLIRVAALSVALLIVGVFIYLGRSNVKNVENTLTQTKKQYLLDLLRVEIKAFQAATDQIGADLSLLGTALLAGENGDAPANITVALGSIVHLREHFNLMV
ncbi:MAG TPA: hypothetical protein PLP17_16875, partial [Oligoflexia bacterium]|nr:hypothetical protein [Oligoflexia bacterium]